MILFRAAVLVSLGAIFGQLHQIHRDITLQTELIVEQSMAPPSDPAPPMPTPDAPAPLQQRFDE
jgi:hypothetical protein